MALICSCTLVLLVLTCSPGTVKSTGLIAQFVVTHQACALVEILSWPWSWLLQLGTQAQILHSCKLFGLQPDNCKTCCKLYNVHVCDLLRVSAGLWVTMMGIL